MMTVLSACRLYQVMLVMLSSSPENRLSVQTRLNEMGSSTLTRLATHINEIVDAI